MELEQIWENHKKNGNFNGSTEGENLFKNNNSYRCEKCRDRGFFIVAGKPSKCDKCDGVPKKDELLELSQDDIESSLDRLNIPEYFKGREFNPDVIKKDENLDLEIRKDVMMDFYIHQIKKIHDQFLLGKKLDNSYIVMAPQGYGKSHLVYSSIQEALKHGFSVAPYYDTSELYKMFYSDDMNLKEVLESDVCFIKILTAFVSKKDTQAVKYVLDKRARRNLPTIVTSRFNMGYLKDIEPHLGNNFGLKNVDKGDFSKLKEVLGPYPKNYDKFSDKKWSK